MSKLSLYARAAELLRKTIVYTPIERLLEVAGMIEELELQAKEPDAMTDEEVLRRAIEEDEIVGDHGVRSFDLLVAEVKRLRVVLESRVRLADQVRDQNNERIASIEADRRKLQAEWEMQEQTITALRAEIARLQEAAEPAAPKPLTCPACGGVVRIARFGGMWKVRCGDLTGIVTDCGMVGQNKPTEAEAVAFWKSIRIESDSPNWRAAAEKLFDAALAVMSTFKTPGDGNGPENGLREAVGFAVVNGVTQKEIREEAPK